jgi:sugar-phosphatase
VLISSQDVTQGKPSPEPYLKGATSLGFEASDCLVVEDAPAGIRAGQAAGARVLALRTTEQDDQVLRAAGANWIVDDCSAISAEQKDGRIILTL